MILEWSVYITSFKGLFDIFYLCICPRCHYFNKCRFAFTHTLRNWLVLIYLLNMYLHYDANISFLLKNFLQFFLTLICAYTIAWDPLWSEMKKHIPKYQFSNFLIVLSVFSTDFMILWDMRNSSEKPNILDISLTFIASYNSWQSNSAGVCIKESIKRLRLKLNSDDRALNKSWKHIPDNSRNTWKGY